MFTGYMILSEDNKDLYSRCHETWGGADLSLVRTVRDRDFPKMRIARWVQGNNTPTVYKVLVGV